MAKLLTAGKFYGNCVGAQYAAADLTGSYTIFTITGGPIRIKALGMLVQTATPAGANTLLFQFTPTGGSATDLCSATDTASADAQQLFVVDGTKATALVKCTDVGILAAGQSLSMTNIFVSEGAITVTWSGGPPATGAVEFFLEYSPLSSLTQVKIGS